MYGIIHRALEDLVTQRFGFEQWAVIASTAGVSSAELLTMRNYSDETTMALVASASEHLGVDTADCLEMFGHFWVTEFAPKDFTTALPSTGSDSFDYIASLNHLHERLASVFIRYQPPRFDIVERDRQSLLVSYSSTRSGLSPFVLGLLNGIADRTGQKLAVEMLSTRREGDGESTLFKLVKDDAL